MLEDLKDKVFKANLDLVKQQLVIFTWGNVSGIDREKGLIVIKPSGVSYDDMKAQDMVVVDLKTGKTVEGDLNPSSDTPTHLTLYRAFPNIGGVVHTHSTYATAWAATGQNIPCGLTMMGDEFGGPVPVGPFRLIGSEAIGKGVVETLKKYPKSPAVLMQNHGPFTIGKDAEGAVKAAAMTEEVARTMWAAKQIGDIIPIAQEDIDKLNDRYTNVYGQH